MWGGLALILEVVSNLAGVALSADPEFPNSPGNDKGLYYVENSFYTVAPIGRVVYGFFKCLMLAANIQFYGTRIAEYGVSIPRTDQSFYLDLAMLVITPFFFIPYIYKMAYAILDIIWFSPFFA